VEEVLWKGKGRDEKRRGEIKKRKIKKQMARTG
jgi:hypothetical protein